MNPALRVLLEHGIDYAGMFPPAALDVRSAASHFSAYRTGADSWALGRFVAPSARLPELESALRHGELAGNDEADRGCDPWRISALIGADAVGDWARVRDLNQLPREANHLPVRVETVEVRCDTTAAVTAVAAVVPPELPCFVEIPVRDDPSSLVAAIGAAGLFAKIRTGGVTVDTFPLPADVVRFIRCCAHQHVAFKATAGLHHPMGGEYPLTYEPSSIAPRGMMFGFLNLLAAAAFVVAGADDHVVRSVLESRTPEEMSWDAGGLAWGGQRIALDELRRMRSHLLLSFGSCSFLEPLEGLRALGLA